VFSADRYLQRIGMSAHTGPPTLELLAALQLAHLTHVPFENLHVFHHRGVRTDIEWSYPKIVEQQRGGWCFELNGCFGALLRAVGFDADYISCQVWDPPGEWGPPLDHLGLLVDIDGERWFVDVGFGDNCLVPLPIVDGDHPATPRPARIEMDSDSFLLTELTLDDGWVPQLRGGLQPRQLADFTPRSEYLETAPHLSWSQKPFASRALDGDGSRVTLRRDVLRERSGTGAFVDTPVAENEWSELLAGHFGLDDTLGR
jgi:N-hydroxyarylamine O-acetyltransferase